MISVDPLQCEIMLDGKITEQVMEFTYLHFLIINSRQLQKEVNI